jgi:hypothetical protein
MPTPHAEGWKIVPLPRTRGLLLHVGGIVLCALLIGFMLTGIGLAGAGLSLILLLVASLLASLLLALLLFRAYGLWRAGYWISRAGLRLRWGNRQVDLPYDAVLDLAAANEIDAPPQPPRWSWPGSITGVRQDPELGRVEFMAAEADKLVYIGTEAGVYVISPENPAAFLRIYRDQEERGSLRAMPSRSIAPTFALGEAWNDLRLRRLLITGAALAVLLLVLVGAIAPGRESVSLGFDADGQPLPVLPGTALFLLPALNLLFFFGNLLVGLLVYRGREQTEFTQLLWGGSLATGVFFLMGVLILL